MKKVLLIGASQMAIDYLNVLKDLDSEITVIGRSEANAKAFQEKTGHEVFIGGLEIFLNTNSISTYDCCIVAVGLDQLKNTALLLLQNDAKSILLEKPGGINFEEINEVFEASIEQNANVYIAYNRRFYSSVINALELIEKDGGVTSFHFEFTEWSHKIQPLEKKPGVKEAWFIGNSTHVVDMAFFLGGHPKKLHSYATTPNSWHSVTNFVGCGITDKNALFSYQANWQAPGRWSVEIMTNKNRYIFKPLEELRIQQLGSIEINQVIIDNELDIKYKPGLFHQTRAFLEKDVKKLKSIQEQVDDMKTYELMVNGEMS